MQQLILSSLNWHLYILSPDYDTSNDVLTFLFQCHEDYKSTDHCFHCLCQSPVFKNTTFTQEQQQNVLVTYQFDVFVLYLVLVV